MDIKAILKIIALALICGCAAVQAYAQTAYQARQFTDKSYTLQYREAVFTSDTDTTQSVIVVLHARHGNGYANDAHLKADGVKEIERYLTDNHRSAILIVPQIAHPREWNEQRAVDGQYMTDIVRNLILTYTDSLPSARVYALGASMGGSGVWRLVNDNPRMFAAAMTAAANPRDVKIQNMLYTPILAVVGTRDRMVKAGNIERTASKINRAGGCASVVTLDGYTHGETCRSAFTPANLAWLFTH